MYSSQAGADSYMLISTNRSVKVNELALATANGKMIYEILEYKDTNVGLFMFSFTDGWWKAGNPEQQYNRGWAPYISGVPYDVAAKVEYWGIVDIDRNKKLA